MTNRYQIAAERQEAELARRRVAHRRWIARHTPPAPIGTPIKWRVEVGREWVGENEVRIKCVDLTIRPLACRL